MRDIVMVVGSGMMGSGIGAMSALAGNKTVLVDTSAERAENGRKKAIECIRLREENELNTHEEAEKAIELLSTSDDSIKTAENWWRRATWVPRPARASMIGRPAALRTT